MSRLLWGCLREGEPDGADPPRWGARLFQAKVGRLGDDRILVHTQTSGVLNGHHHTALAITNPALRQLVAVGGIDQLTHANDMLINFTSWPTRLTQTYRPLLRPG